MNAALEAADIVWFDVCETLFIRPLVEPEHLFDLVGARVGIVEFKRRRIAAEALARSEAAARGAAVTLDSIYERLEATPAQRDLARRTEYRFELALWRPVPDAVASFRAVAAAGRAVLSGTTHLPAGFFDELLALHDLPAAPVILSDAEWEADRALSPVELIARHMNVRPDRILPFATGRAGDVDPVDPPERPVTEGIASLAFGLRRIGGDGLGGARAALGFEIAGPALTGFVHWLGEQARRDQIDLLLFCSGPGMALIRIAEGPYPPLLPRHGYFATGPAAILLAGTHDRNFDARLELFMAGCHGMRAFEVLERFDIPVPAPFMMADIGLGDDVVIDHATEPLLRRFLSAYRWEILKVARRNRRGLFRELLDLGAGPNMRVALVDLGWDGSLLESFIHTVQDMIEIEIFGYSFCLLDTQESRRRQGLLNLKGLLSRSSLPPEQLAAIGANHAAIELLFTPPHREIIGLDDLPGAVARIESRKGYGSDRLEAVSTETSEGVAAFAALFNTFCARAGFEPDPIAVCQPFLAVAADAQAVAGPVVAALEVPATA
ncbi:hypothetical protein [Roseixanthobacter pseudopolyaromaticivorans]|uniref:hypothetical protein n=1 Tax=Xanthobacteraceae TaxID=335928 RepID=UPI0037297FD6